MIDNNVEIEKILGDMKNFFSSNISVGGNIDFNYVGDRFVNIMVQLQGKIQNNGMFLAFWEEYPELFFLTRSLNIPGVKVDTKVIRSNYLVYNNDWDKFFENDNTHYCCKSVDRIKKKYENMINNNFDCNVEFLNYGAFYFEHNISLSCFLLENAKIYKKLLDYIREGKKTNSSLYVFYLSLSRIPVNMVKFYNVNVFEVGDISMSMEGGDFITFDVKFGFDYIEYNPKIDIGDLGRIITNLFKVKI